MKHVLFSLLLVCSLLVGCEPVPDNLPKFSMDNRVEYNYWGDKRHINVLKFEYEGHGYIMFNAYGEGAVGFVLDPNDPRNQPQSVQNQPETGILSDAELIQKYNF